MAADWGEVSGPAALIIAAATAGKYALDAIAVRRHDRSTAVQADAATTQATLLAMVTEANRIAGDRARALAAMEAELDKARDDRGKLRGQVRDLGHEPVA